MGDGSGDAAAKRQVRVDAGPRLCSLARDRPQLVGLGSRRIPYWSLRATSSQPTHELIRNEGRRILLRRESPESWCKTMPNSRETPIHRRSRVVVAILVANFACLICIVLGSWLLLRLSGARDRIATIANGGLGVGALKSVDTLEGLYLPMMLGVQG